MDNFIIAIFGRKGSGKSTLAREITYDFSRVVAFDALGEYDESAGFTVMHGLEESARALQKTARADIMRLSLRCDDTSDFLKLLRIAYELPDTLLLVEETSLYCKPSFLPDELSKLVRYGRHRQIHLLFIARRPSELHRDLTAQADVIISFQQHEPRDVLYLRAIVGPDAERLYNIPPFAILAFGETTKFPVPVLERLEEQERRG